MSSITGNGQLDFEMLFNFLMSVQNLLVPSFLSMTIIGKLQGDLDGHITFAANISFTALATIWCLAKGVLYGLNLIGGWLPVSIFILIILGLPWSVSFFCKEIYNLFYLIFKWFSMINRYNYPLFQVIKRTYIKGSLLFPLLQIINIYKVTFLQSSIFPKMLPFLSQISLLVLLIRNTENLTCLLVVTIELTVGRPGYLLIVLSTVE